MCRPLYYYYPEVKEAYDWNEEYLFGDNILASAICEPLGSDSTSARKVWLPAGEWYDMAHGNLLKGGKVYDLKYAIEQSPWFVRSGAVIPLAEEGIRNLQDPSNALRLMVVPGKASCTIEHYEDDGISQSYEREYARTTIEKNVIGSKTVIKIGARKGSYAGAPATRRISVVLQGVHKIPASVRLDGEAIPADAVYHSGGSITIQLPESPADSAQILEIR